MAPGPSLVGCLVRSQESDPASDTAPDTVAGSTQQYSSVKRARHTAGQSEQDMAWTRHGAGRARFELSCGYPGWGWTPGRGAARRGQAGPHADSLVSTYCVSNDPTAPAGRAGQDPYNERGAVGGRKLSIAISIRPGQPGQHKVHEGSETRIQ